MAKSEGKITIGVQSKGRNAIAPLFLVSDVLSSSEMTIVIENLCHSSMD